MSTGLVLILEKDSLVLSFLSFLSYVLKRPEEGPAEVVQNHGEEDQRLGHLDAAADLGLPRTVHNERTIVCPLSWQFGQLPKRRGIRNRKVIPDDPWLGHLHQTDSKKGGKSH